MRLLTCYNIAFHYTGNNKDSIPTSHCSSLNDISIHQCCIVLTLLCQANFIFEPVSMVSEQKTIKLICFHCTTPLVLNMTLFP